MKCQTPITVRNPKDKNEFVTVPCGACVFCYQRRKMQWAIRLKEESKVSTSQYFITLTYSDEKVPFTGDAYTLIKTDVQLFLKRLRKKNVNKLRYYLVGEYGSKTQRPHYHMIIFNIDDKYVQNIDRWNKFNIDNLVYETWQNGQIKVGEVTDASIQYTLKYMLKDFDNEMNYGDLEIQKPFALMSKGLGKSYVSKNRRYHNQNFNSARGIISDDTRNYYTLEEGVKVALPRYYREKIYTRIRREAQNEQAKNRLSKDSLEKVKKDASLKNQRIEAYKSLVKKRLNQNKKL